MSYPLDLIDQILLAEDSPDDVVLMRRALMKAQFAARVTVVSDGEEAVAYMEGLGKYSDRLTYPRPSLIFLDIKMPRMSGIEVLEWLRSNPQHQVIPTIIMSSSNLENDVRRAYLLGVNTYFVKPGNFHDLVGLLQMLGSYWSAAQKPRGVLLPAA